MNGAATLWFVSLPLAAMVVMMRLPLMAYERPRLAVELGFIALTGAGGAVVGNEAGAAIALVGLLPFLLLLTAVRRCTRAAAQSDGPRLERALHLVRLLSWPTVATPMVLSFSREAADLQGRSDGYVQEVRALTNLGLKEAKDLVEAAPKAILEKVNKETAEKAKEQLEGAGAKVTLK